MPKITKTNKLIKLHIIMFTGLMYYQYQYMYENDNISNDNQKIFTPKNETKKNSEFNYQKAESMYYNLLSTLMNHYTS